MRISKRLKTIAANIEAEKLLDIGCDHAYLPIYLIKEGRVKKAIACDISKGAVDRANENIKKHGYDEFISTIVSDGLDTVDLDNVDCISICGLGAITAVNILNKDKDKLQNINKLIISPQSDIQFCIDEIQKLGYKVVLEDFVEDHNKFYPIFVFEKGDAAEPFIFGSLLSENKDYKKYILLKQQKLKEIRQRIEAEQSTKVNMNKDIENVKTANVEVKDDLSNSYKNITLKEIIEKLEELSPKKYALNWDNVGLLVGSEEKRVSKVLVAVEITDELINLAIHDDIDLIITHHPLIFNSLKRIVYEDFIGRKIINLVKHNIALYCMHTNFDICGSMASIAASKLWLGDVKTLIQTSEDGKGIGVIGNLAHINFKSLAFVVKDTFNVEQLKIYGDYNKLVSRIAIIPGSAGREEIQKTIVEGAEVLISGDISHHNGIDAVDQGLFIIDAGHYGMEKIFNEFIVNYLKDNIEGLEVFQEENKENLSGCSMEVKIKVKNTNQDLEINCGSVTFREVANQCGLGDSVYIAYMGNRIYELNKYIKKAGEIEFFGMEDKHGIEVYRRSAIFLMVKSFYDIIDIEKDIRLQVDNLLGDGFYCRITNLDQLEEKCGMKHDDLINRLRERMHTLVIENAEFKKEHYHIDDAMMLFNRYKMYDKERLFHYRRSNGVNIYRLHRFEDYYYGHMLPSTGYIKKFELYKMDGGLLLQCPNKNKELKELKVPLKLFNEFRRTFNWISAQKIVTVADLNDLICANDKRIDEIIQVQESYHDMQLSLIADNISKRDNVKFVMIAGPSSSGKTTFSKRLNIQLLAKKLKPYYLGIDNYYKDRNEIPVDESGKRDFESLDAIDVDLFNDHMQELFAGKEISLPTYNFVKGEKEYHGNTIKLSDNQILVVEGIHGLNDKFSSSLDKDSKYKIYISPITQLNIDEHNRIPTSDVRLLRRIVRDARTRGTDAATTISMWKSVRAGEEKYIFPFQEDADIMFNSALIYELSVLKVYVQPLLFGIKRTDPNYVEAKRLLKFLDYFVGIDSGRIPRDSIVREFIGGSFFDVG